MTPAALGALVSRDARLLLPVGMTESVGPGLPFGCDTIIVERLADDLSIRHGLVRAPTLEFGVGDRPSPGGAVLRRRTLHRLMNELIESWEEEAGIGAFIVLTAHASDAHLEALSTIRTEGADVQAIDVFALDFRERLSSDTPEGRLRELRVALLGHLAPELLGPDLAMEWPSGAQRGAEMYTFLLDRLSTHLAPP